MPNFAVEYTYAPDRAAVRDEHRPAHRQWLGDGHERGIVRMAGPFVDGSGAWIMVAADDERGVRDFLAGDPFAAVDGIAAVRIHEWLNVFGPFGS
ncbi:MAG: YciI family protein [Gordonia sp. (in: high G+C Gram-positive bacteria)]|uniref:YciI family protein n=1 Tax=Gordonia sp. (in: high G+C Gram-positive bacteria) TaxID=84139 RepID=UPI0039E49033